MSLYKVMKLHYKDHPECINANIDCDWTEEFGDRTEAQYYCVECGEYLPLVIHWKKAKKLIANKGI